MSPDGSKVWVSNRGSGSVSEIDTATASVIKTITVGTEPSDIAVSPNASSVWVTNNGTGMNSVTQIDASTGLVVQTIQVGQYPQNLTVSPDSSTVWVNNAGDDTVSEISVPANSPTTIPTTTPAVTTASIKTLAATGTNLTIPLGLATALLGLGGLGVLGAQRGRRRV